MSTSTLSVLLAELTRSARLAGWTDAEWARRSGVPKETLCRLRSRATCDFATLQALSRALGSELTVGPSSEGVTADGLWPAVVDRRLEARLVQAAVTRASTLADWRSLGPCFFLAGLAVTLASVTGMDRGHYLSLAEALHPGATELRVFQKWLAETPLPPSRFLPMLEAAQSNRATGCMATS